MPEFKVIHPLVIFLFALGVCVGWLELQARLFPRRPGASRDGRDLLYFGLFLALLAALTPGETGLVASLVAGCAVLAVGGQIAITQALGPWGLRFAELAAFLCLVRGGIEIQFFQLPSEQYVYLNEWSVPVTVAWLALIVNLIGLSRLLPGLCRGVLALMACMLLGAVMLHHPRSGAPDATAFALVLVAATGAFWVHGHRSGPGRTGAVATSLWATCLAILPIVSTTKRIALVSLVTPLLLLAAPVLFLTYVFVTSYLGPNLAGRNGQRFAFRWNLTMERSVDLVLLMCLMGNLIALVYLFTANLAWAALLLALSAVVLWRLASFVLLVERTGRSTFMDGKVVDVLGVPFPAHDFEQVMARAEEMLTDGRRHYVITPDALSLLRTLRDDRYRQVVLDADLCVPDGAGVVWAADVLYESPVLQRVPGVELVDRLAQLCEDHGWSVYLLGARPEVLPAAVEALRRRHPRLRIAGARDGFFSGPLEEEILAEIEAARPDVLLVALGVPKQELWIAENLGRLPCSLMMGVGGTFDVLAGAAVRAPRLFRTTGLEWLYRVLREPHRWRRIASLPSFILEVLRQKLEQKRLELDSDAEAPLAWQPSSDEAA